jgi:hypothetical protein
MNIPPMIFQNPVVFPQHLPDLEILSLYDALHRLDPLRVQAPVGDAEPREQIVL